MTLGLPFDRVTMRETLDDCVDFLKSTEPHYIVTANLDFACQAERDPDLRLAIARADRVLCDGFPPMVLSRFLGCRIPERVAGSDLVPALFPLCARENLSVFLLGSDGKTLQETISKLREEHPALKVSGVSPPHGKVQDWPNQEIVERIRQSQAELLLVATGCPKQERWISRFHKETGCTLAIGVGASLDFITGKQTRAPVLAQRLHLEWFWRFAEDPKRLGPRYGKNLLFLMRAAWDDLFAHRLDCDAVPSRDWNTAIMEAREQWKEGTLAPPLGNENLEKMARRTGYASFFRGTKNPTKAMAFHDVPWTSTNKIATFAELEAGAILPADTPPVVRSQVRHLGFRTSGEVLRVLISAGMIQDGRSGVGRYVIELVKELAQKQTEIRLIVAGLDRDRSRFPKDVEWVRIPDSAAPGLQNLLWHQWNFGNIARKLRADIVHIPSYRRMLWRCPVPQIATIHDCAPFVLRKKYDTARGILGRIVAPALARRTDRIITISKFTRNDIEKHMKVDRENIDVIKQGLNSDAFQFSGIEETRRKCAELGLPERYFVYVARLEHPAKNHLRLIDAFQRFRVVHPQSNHHLVLAGSDWHGAEAIHAAIDSSAFSSSILRLGFVDDKTLPALYAGAEAMVMPSLFEGFGLPVIEAMACGTPVLCANAGSLPEVAGGHAHLFDPLDPQAIAHALGKAVKEKPPPHGEPGLISHAAAFSWSECARQTLKVYQKTHEK